MPAFVLPSYLKLPQKKTPQNHLVKNHPRQQEPRTNQAWTRRAGCVQDILLYIHPYSLHTNTANPSKVATFTPTPPAKPEQTQRKLSFGSSTHQTKQIESMRVGASFKILEKEGPTSHQIQSINAWMKTKIHDVSVHGKLDDLAKKLDEQMALLPIGQTPSVNRYLAEWGMEPTKASKYKPREAIKLLCILHEIRQ